MTKKHDQAASQHNDSDIKNLEEVLEEVKSDKDNEEMIEKLQAEIKKLQVQLAEKDEIVKNAQLAYLRAKNDMEMIQRQSAMKAESMHQDLLIKIVKKILPFVEDLRKSLENLSDEDKNSPMWKWVQMVHDRFIKALEGFKVFPIPSLHESPDTLMHEPIWMQPTDDKKLKWKIIQVFEQWFYYQKENWDKITIFPSKVVIGQ